MTHDPMCEKYFHPYAAGFSNDSPCTICALIAEIREHERTSADALIGKERQWESGRKYGFSEGLDAARDAVAAADPYWKVEGDDGAVFVVEVAEALAAIDALRGESND